MLLPMPIARICRALVADNGTLTGDRLFVNSIILHHLECTLPTLSLCVCTMLPAVAMLQHRYLEALVVGPTHMLPGFEMLACINHF